MNATCCRICKHGLRVLVRTPLFTICTIAALAIGIGSTTALFSVVHAMLVKPLPYADADRLLVIWEHNLPRNRPRNVVNVVNFMGWRDRSRNRSTAWRRFTQNRVTLTGSGEPQELSTLIVTANMFDVLGASPMLGRAFLAGEDQSTSERTMVLSHAAWLRQFGGDGERARHAASRSNGEPVTVIGVMPRGLRDLRPAGRRVSRRSASARKRARGGRSLVAIGRMKPGVTRDQAQAELEGVMTGLRNEQPDFNTGWTVNAGAAARAAGRRHPARGAGAVRRRRRGVADRLRQHRQPDADARVGAPPRARDSIGDRRRHRPAADAAGVRIADARRSPAACSACMLARWMLSGLTIVGVDRVCRCRCSAQVAIDPSVLIFAARDHDPDDAGVRTGSGDRRHRRLARDGAARRRAERVGQRARAVRSGRDS